MANDGPNPDTIVQFIADIFDRRGAEAYLGEDVTMSEHMLQAAHLAEQSGADDELVAGALLHDIGHFTNEFPDDALEAGVNNYHDHAGATVISRFFPEKVVDCVRWHVAAKRYLCATEADYFGKLSAASVHTLNLQGGPMNAGEVAEFAQNPNLDAILQVRRWDEEGKAKGRETPGFGHFVPVLQALVEKHAAR